jgi:hypothetical protein
MKLDLTDIKAAEQNPLQTLIDLMNIREDVQSILCSLERVLEIDPSAAFNTVGNIVYNWRQNYPKD